MPLERVLVVVLVNTFNSAQNSPEKQNRKEKEKITANLRFQKSFRGRRLVKSTFFSHRLRRRVSGGHCCHFPLRSRSAQRLFVQSHSLRSGENTIRAHCAAPNHSTRIEKKSAKGHLLGILFLPIYTNLKKVRTNLYEFVQLLREKNTQLVNCGRKFHLLETCPRTVRRFSLFIEKLRPLLLETKAERLITHDT